MELARREKWLIGAALGVAALIYLTMPRNPTVEPAAARGERPRMAAPRIGHGAVRAPLPDFAHRVVGDSAADALFAAHSWYTPPPTPPPAPQPTAIVRAPPSAPTAPPLPYAYMGSWLRDGGQPVFFLTRGDRIYDVRAGDTLDGLYRFEGLSGSTLLFTYAPLKIRQTLSVNSDQ